MLVSAYLVVGPIVAAPQIQYLFALIFIFAGLIFYVPFVYYKKVLPGMGKKHVLTITLIITAGDTERNILQILFYRGTHNIFAEILPYSPDNRTLTFLRFSEPVGKNKP